MGPHEGCIMCDNLYAALLSLTALAFAGYLILDETVQLFVTTTQPVCSETPDD